MFEYLRIKDYNKTLLSLKLDDQLRQQLALQSTAELRQKLMEFSNSHPNITVTIKTYVSYVVLSSFMGSFKDRLKKFYSMSSSRNVFTKSLKIIRELFPTEFENLQKESGVDTDKLLTLYIIDKLNHCEVCGTACEGRFCSNKCKSQVIGKENIKKAIQAVIERKDEIVEKRKKTVKTKYGVDYYTQTQEYRDKVKNTNLIRYGVESSNQAAIVKEKMRQSKLARYGDANYNNRDKYKETFRKNFNAEDNILKLESKNIEKYGVPVRAWTHYKNYTNLNHEFVKLHFVTETNLFKFKEFVDYFEIPYLKTAYDIKERLGFKDILNEHHYNTLSRVEKELFEWFPVEDKVSNNRKVLDGLEIDIYSPSLKLGIEYDGIYWHSTAVQEDPNYHIKKLNLAESKGITLYNIFENIDDLDIWKSMILARLGKARRISARKCELRALRYRDVRDFLAENHLQGSVVSSVQYGLFYDGELVEVMTFAKPRFARQYDFELVRLCTKKGLLVVGGASRLWTAFRREHPTASVISYANRRFSQGKVYRTLGFSLVKTTAPNYVYVRQEEVVDVAVDVAVDVVTRYQAQKHRLASLLGEAYDPDCSESENMTAAGYERLYDCGNMVFEFRPKL